jgi:hypothetical protein
VQLYLNGHDHNLQLIEKKGVAYVTSGAGSATRKGFSPANSAAFQYDSSGFVTMEAARAHLEIKYWAWEKEKPIFTRRLLPPPA